VLRIASLPAFTADNSSWRRREISAFQLDSDETGVKAGMSADGPMESSAKQGEGLIPSSPSIVGDFGRLGCRSSRAGKHVTSAVTQGFLWPSATARAIHPLAAEVKAERYRS